jgi:DNA-binding NarL/FixJ family response regulator
MRDASGGFYVYTGIVGEEESMDGCILIADDQPQVRRALRLLLEQALGTTTVAEAAGAQDLLVQVAARCPELVLLDWGLPGMAAVDLPTALRERCAALTIVVLSGQPEAEQDALRAGADAFVSKADPPEMLLAAIRSKFYHLPLSNEGE